MRRVAVATGLLLLASLTTPMIHAGAATRPVDRDGNKIFDNLDAAMRGAKADARFGVIAIFAGGTSAGHASSARKAVGNFTVGYEYKTMPAFSATMTAGQVRSLAARGETVQIQKVSRMRATMNTAKEAFGVNKAVADFGVTGNKESGACPGIKAWCADDVTVVVIDTGIDAGHTDLNEGQVIGFADCTGDGICDERTPVDDHGHGTHVSSIIAGQPDGSTTLHGVAYGAALVGVKVLDSTGYGDNAWVDAGIEWAITNQARFGIDVLNMSLGDDSFPSDGTDSTSRLVNRAAAAGITPFVAAGNSGPTDATILAPGVAKFAVTVGAMADPMDDPSSLGGGPYPAGFGLADFSSRGPVIDGRVKPDIAAAGVDIAAAAAGTAASYTVMSGTSMATPFAAGAGALVLDANPGLGSRGTACAPSDTNPDCTDGVYDATMSMTLRDALTSTAQHWGQPGQNNDYGSGRLQVYEAVKLALAGTGTGPAVPTHTYAEGTLAATNDVAWHDIPVTSTAFPIAITFVTQNWAPKNFEGFDADPDLDIELYDPSGAQRASSTGVMRQETIAFKPGVTGTWRLRVLDWFSSHAATYWFDASYGGGAAPPPPPTDTTNPTTPANLTATAASKGAKIALAWGASTDSGGSGLAGYRIFRATSASGPFTQIAQVTGTSYTNTGLKRRTTYWYYVIAYDNAGNVSAQSNTASATAR